MNKRMGKLTQLWHSSVMPSMYMFSVLLGTVALIVALILLTQRRWVEAVALLVTGVPLLVTSLGHLLARTEPRTTLCTSQGAINEFMREFVSLGSPVHIASYRLSWVRGDKRMQVFLADQVKKGKQINILAGDPEDDLIRQLRSHGVRVTTYPPGIAAPPRFTLINSGKAGQERMAVAREGLPTHWIDEYDYRHHPQVITLARSYIELAERSNE